MIRLTMGMMLWILLALWFLTNNAEPASRVNGEETIEEFRTWSEPFQLGYVLGWRSHSALLSVRCQRVVTNGEYLAALRYDPRFSNGDRVTKALIALEVRDGCAVER